MSEQTEIGLTGPVLTDEVRAKVERAIRKHHQVSDCPACGGPRAHSKDNLRHTPCLACGQVGFDPTTPDPPAPQPPLVTPCSAGSALPVFGPQSQARVINQQAVSLADLALKQGHRIAGCPACLGPLVYSKQARDCALCLACGYRLGETRAKCWTCGAPMVQPDLPPELEQANSQGRADIEAMAPYRTCEACGGMARKGQTRRGHYRHCESCGTRLTQGRRVGRALALCQPCRASRLRLQNREAQRRWKQAGGKKIAPDNPNVYGPVLT